MATQRKRPLASETPRGKVAKLLIGARRSRRFTSYRPFAATLPAFAVVVSTCTFADSPWFSKLKPKFANRYPASGVLFPAASRGSPGCPYTVDSIVFHLSFQTYLPPPGHTNRACQYFS